MMQMINKKRVQRIKNLIYAFIILVIFLPLILVSILSFQMFGAIKDLNTKVDSFSKIAASQAAAESSAPDSGYVIEPEDQALKPTDTNNQETEKSEPEMEQQQDDAPEANNPPINNENLTATPNNGLSGTGTQSGDTLLSANGGNELGGGAPIEPDDEYLAATGTGAGAEASTSASSGTSAEGQLAGNPQMGYADGVPASDYTLNPSTGS